MGTTASGSFRKEVPKKESSALCCTICDKPVAIENAKSDCDGNSFHRECYAIKVELEQATRDGHANVNRPWKAVAAEISREQDPKKMTELVTELNQALDEQNLDGTPKLKPDSKPKPDGE